MSEKIAVIISPNWGDYAEKYLADCLKSLAVQDYPGGFKLFLIDNESTAKSQDLLCRLAQKHYAGEFVVVANKDNAGFARGNNKAMSLALAEGYDYLTLFNMDTVIDERGLGCLVEAMRADEHLGATQARLMLYHRPEVINSLGNVTHFLGFGYCRGYGEKIEQPELIKTILSDISYPSGAAVMFRATALKAVGLFDETFWMYNEDQDLGWRLALAGWRLALVPQAVVWHKYQFLKSKEKYYWLDRNRLLVIFKNYHLATLILIAPALIVMEMGLWLFAWQAGHLGARLRVYWYFWQPSTWVYLFKVRRQVQALRTVSDRRLVGRFSGRILYQEINSPSLRLANLFLNAYWLVAKNLILW